MLPWLLYASIYWKILVLDTFYTRDSGMAAHRLGSVTCYYIKLISVYATTCLIHAPVEPLRLASIRPSMLREVVIELTKTLHAVRTTHVWCLYSRTELRTTACRSLMRGLCQMIHHQFPSITATKMTATSNKAPAEINSVKVILLGVHVAI
jgi:hypothetical protein